MKRHEIESGMIVQMRDGSEFLVLYDDLYFIPWIKNQTSERIIKQLEDYDNNLLFEFPFRNESDESRYDIVKVYDGKHNIIWERKDLAKSSINIGDVFVDTHDSENILYIKKACHKSDTYIILLNEDDITWEFEEDGETIRNNYRKVFNIKNGKT